MARVHVESETKVTVAELVKIADAIWAHVRAQRGHEPAVLDQLMTRIQRDCPQFCMAYPVVIKYMIYMRMYDTTTFKLWLDRIHRAPWTNESTYLDALADYATALTVTTTRRSGKGRVNSVSRAAFYKGIRASLQAEHDELKKAAETAAADVKAEHDQYEAEVVDQLASAARAFGTGGMKSAGTFRVETDDADGRITSLDALDALDTLPALGAEFDL